MELHVQSPLARPIPPPTETWVADGNNWPIYEGDLIGDRRGLEKLRDAISTALDSPEGRAKLRAYWCDIRLVEEHPDATKAEKGRLRRAIESIAAMCVFLFIIFCTIYGFTQIPHLFK